MVWFLFAGTSIQLVPDGTLVLHLIAIIVMVMVLNRTLFRPVNRILAERSLLTEGMLDEAKLTVAKIDEELAACEQSLRGARAEGYRLMEGQKSKAVAERDAEIARVKAEVGQVTADSKSRLGKESELARERLRIEAQRIGLEIGSRILGRALSG